MRGHHSRMDFLRFWCGKQRRSLGLSAVVLVVGACSSEGNYFDDPPPPRGGMGGTATTAGRGGSGSAGTSAAGSASAGRMGVGGDGVGGGTGGGSVGGSGADGGTGGGAMGGAMSMGGSAGKGGTGGGTGGSGGSAGVGGANAGVGGVVAGTGGLGEAGLAGEIGLAGAGPEPCVPQGEVCDGLDNDCDDETDEEGCPAACTAKFYAGHSYLLCMTTNEDRQLAYSDANGYCDDAKSDLDLSSAMALVRIESHDESDVLKAWVRTTAPADGMIWIGANDLDDENTWVWGRGPNAVQFFQGSNRGGGMPVDGAFNDFGPDRPNAVNGEDEDCGAMDSEFDWQWNDIVCSKPRLGFICEQKP